MVTKARCPICSKISPLTYVNVDDEMPSTIKKLQKLISYKSKLPGLEWYGFDVCPECGAYYYHETEISYTGSQMNDDHNIYRLNPIEMEMLKPLLDLIRHDPENDDLNQTLDRLTLHLADMPYRGYCPRDVVVATIQTLSDEMSDRDIPALLVNSIKSFVLQDPKNCKEVLDIINNSYFNINKDAQGVQEVIRLCN